MGVHSVSITEQKGNTPDARDRDQGKDNTADDCSLSTKQPTDNVKRKDSNAAPVKSTDDYKNECKFIEHNNISFKANSGQ